MEHFLISDHDLEHQVGLDKVEVLSRSAVQSSIAWNLGLGGVLKEHDEALARLVVGFLYLATKTPTSKGVFI